MKSKHRTQPNLYLHLFRNTLIGFMMIAAALFIGMLGYHLLEGMPWIDAFFKCFHDFIWHGAC
jgi:hypothetical protein